MWAADKHLQFAFATSFSSTMVFDDPAWNEMTFISFLGSRATVTCYTDVIWCWSSSED